jgi:hypothetical protein
MSGTLKNSTVNLFLPSLILGGFFETFLVAMTIIFPESRKILLWHIWIICSAFRPPSECATLMDVFSFFLGFLVGVPIYGVLAYLILKSDKGIVEYTGN